MPVFERESRYPFPREEVFAWHTRPGAFTRLSPPGMITPLAGPTDGINVGSRARLVISHPLVDALLPHVPGGRGPIGVPWRVEHVDLVPGERFVDVQVRGPFRRWRHEHFFADGPGGSTVITDRVSYALPVRLPAGVDHALVDLQLDALFAFRERQLRDDLALHAALGASPRRVAVAGASGLIGRQVCALLTTGGHEVVRLVRGGPPAPDAVRWDPSAGELPAGALAGVDVAINLAGHPLAGRFTEPHKRLVLQSRIETGSTLARAVVDAGVPALVQASAIGYYGARRPEVLLTERSAPGHDFLAGVVRGWEATLAPAADAGVRTVALRTGIVLSEAGGALPPQLPLFALGLGGRLAAPDAWLSWISLDDAARAYLHAAFTDLEGPTNLVAPRPATQRGFADALGRVLHRPARVPVPPLGPRLLLGRDGYDLMVDTDQRVGAGKLGEAGFRFRHGCLADALRHVLMR